MLLMIGPLRVSFCHRAHLLLLHYTTHGQQFALGSHSPSLGAILCCTPPPLAPHTHTFLMPQVGLPLASDGCGAMYPLLSAGSMWLVFHLLGSRPRNVTAMVTAPPSVPQSWCLGLLFLPMVLTRTWTFISLSSLGDTFSQDIAGQYTLPSVLQDCYTDLHSYEYILKLVLDDLNKSDLLVRDTPKPCSLWEVEADTPTQSGGGALALDKEMQGEFTAAFWEPSLSAKVISSSSPYRVPTDLYTAPFKAPKVEEEMVKAAVMSVLYPLTLLYGRQWKRSTSLQWRLGISDCTPPCCLSTSTASVVRTLSWNLFVKSLTVRFDSLVRSRLMVRRWPLQLNVAWLSMHQLFGIAGTFGPCFWLPPSLVPRCLVESLCPM